MKKTRILALILCLTFCLSGCENINKNEEIKKEDKKIDKNDNQLIEDNSTSNYSFIGDKSTLDYSNADEESKKLYQSFLEGKTSATVMSTCADATKNKWFKNNFSKDSSYYLQQIIDKYTEVEGMEYQDRITCRYLDCGLDGKYEILVGLSFSLGSTTYLILKNIDNNLYLCFVGDSWNRKYVSFGENGLCGYMWNANGSLHYGNDYYIDAEGNCHFYEYQGFNSIKDDTVKDDYPDSILNKKALNYIEFSFARFSESDSAPTYAYNIDLEINDERIERNDNTEDLFLAAEDILKDQGYVVLEDKEFEEKSKKIREEIGLTDEIFNADISYYN